MNRKLFKSIREYKKESVLAPLFVILEVFMEVLIPLQMARLSILGSRTGIFLTLSRWGSFWSSWQCWRSGSA